MLAGDQLNFNPQLLNSWLLAHNGFEGDLYIWATIEPLGYTFEGETANTTILTQNIDQGKRVILNVRDGTHWVLAIGYNANGFFYVNDPYFDTSTYDFSDVVGSGTYADSISNRQEFLGLNWRSDWSVIEYP